VNDKEVAGSISQYFQHLHRAEQDKNVLPRPAILDDLKANSKLRRTADEAYTSELLARKASSYTKDEQKHLTSRISEWLRNGDPEE
jgi:hypothetical protein